MKQNKMILRLTALLLVLLLVFTACQKTPQPTTPTETEATSTVAPTQTQVQTEPSAETEATTEPPIDPDDEALIRWQNAGQRDYLPDEPVDMRPFSQMEYVRPDTETLYAEFDRLIAKAKDSDDAEELLEDYYRLFDRYVSFYSMDTLANIRYSQDSTDSYYQSEYDFCEAETPTVEEKLEALYKAFAASPARRKLETKYFGRGYFEYYDDYEVYTNPEYLRLSQQEAALLSEYRDLTSDIQVRYKGETKSLDEWLETDNYADYIGSLTAYYDQYNAAVGDVFIRLVQVRQQLAAALDYDSYADYSYEVSYSRDYTPEQGTAFLEGIREYLVPVLEAANNKPALAMLNPGSSTEEKVMEMVKDAARHIGGSVWDAFRFMQAYELCDIAKSPVKVESSFQTYIYDYEAPFVLVNAQGSGEDYTTFAHEFGHFTDSYYNYGANEDLETAETYSQAMEFLALSYTESLSALQQKKLLNYKLLDALQTFVYQGAYADFEARVYALAPEELTLENVNQLFLQCCKDYGVYERGFDFYYSQSWIDVIHFFEVPYYIISYCVSAETALQVYRLEAAEPGSGVAAYFRLLDRDYQAGIQQVMEDAEMENPFREEVLEELAAFFVEKLELN